MPRERRKEPGLAGGGDPDHQGRKDNAVSTQLTPRAPLGTILVVNRPDQRLRPSRDMGLGAPPGKLM